MTAETSAPGGRVFGRRYRSFAVNMRTALDDIQSAVAESYVDGGHETVSGHVHDLKTWGVWVRSPHIAASGKREGQFGILGTSAGLELMASTRDFRDDIRKPERQDLIVGAWLYLHKHLSTTQTVSPGDDVPAPSPPDPRGALVVRQSQVLRALSALEHHLPAVEQDSRTSPVFANRQLAEQVLAELAKCRISDISIAEYPALRELSDGATVIAGYRYLSSSKGTPEDPETLPETPIEWAYLLASVLVALSRAYLAYLLPLADFGKYITKTDIGHLSRWARIAARSENPDELRVGLFAGWSIMQLDLLFESDTERFLGDLHTGGTGGIVDSAVHSIDLALPPKERSNLKRVLRAGAQRVIQSASLQADLHHPYSFHTTTKKSGGGDPYRQDHLVVPTVPIALWLVARLDKLALFDVRVERLALKMAGCFEAPGTPTVAPGQSSTYNGTVNMNYMHEAVAELHDLAVRTDGRSHLWRLGATIRRPHPTFSKVTESQRASFFVAIFLVFLAAPFATWLWRELGIPPSTKDENKPRAVRLEPSRAHGLKGESFILRSGQTVTVVPPPVEKQPRRTRTQTGATQTGPKPTARTGR